MKISIERKELERVFTAVARFAPTRTPKPILRYVKLSAGADGASLSATDLGDGIKHTLTAVDILQAGSALLPITRIGSLLKESSDATFHILATEQGSVSVRSDSTSAILPSEHVADFPVAVDHGTTLDFVRMSAAEFTTLVKGLIYACDDESSRYALGGIQFELKGKILYATATDGRRLVNLTTTVEVFGKPTLIIQHPTRTENGKEYTPDPGPAIVPVAALKRILKALPKSGAVELSTRKDEMFIHTETAVMSSRCLGGRFPQWRKTIPSMHYGESIDLPVKALVTALRSVSSATSESARGVDFVFDNNLLTLTAKSEENGTCSAIVPVGFSSKRPLSITLDSRFVLDFLATCDPKSFFNFRAQDDECCAVMTYGEFTYVQMPLARDKR